MEKAGQKKTDGSKLPMDEWNWNVEEKTHSFLNPHPQLGWGNLFADADVV
jgi:hypothetical protein